MKTRQGAREKNQCLRGCLFFWKTGVQLPDPHGDEQLSIMHTRRSDALFWLPLALHTGDILTHKLANYPDIVCGATGNGPQDLSLVH